MQCDICSVTLIEIHLLVDQSGKETIVEEEFCKAGGGPQGFPISLRRSPIQAKKFDGPGSVVCATPKGTAQSDDSSGKPEPASLGSERTTSGKSKTFSKLNFQLRHSKLNFQLRHF